MPVERLTTQISRLAHQVETLSEDVDELQADVRSLVAAWNTATNLVAFMKWLAAAVVACGVLYAAARNWFGVK